jgi:hypothetical protein
MTDTCKTCRFWHMDTNWSREEGECHIRSPQVVVDADGGAPYAVWPPTRATGWCGEHEPKPIDKADDTEGAA